MSFYCGSPLKLTPNHAHPCTSLQLGFGPLFVLEHIHAFFVSQGSWVRNPVWQHTFVSPSAFSRRAVVSYWRKYVHEVLVNRLGGLSLPRKSVVRLTDRPDMTLDVYRGRKTTIHAFFANNGRKQFLNENILSKERTCWRQRADYCPLEYIREAK